MQRALLVFGAGGAGCLARYLVGLAVGPREFPLPTLIVNVIGSFVLAFVLQIALLRDLPEELRLVLSTGFLGGFTTYSAFNFETTQLVLGGHLSRGLANAAIMLVGSFAAGLAGAWLAQKIAG